MDALSEVLEALRFKGVLYFTTRFAAPWGVRVPDYGNVARFHMAVRGDFWVRIEGVGEAQHIGPGEMIVIPRGRAHILSSTPTTPMVSLEDAIAASGYNGEGRFEIGEPHATDAAYMVCGHFQFDDQLSHPLLEQLPPFILISGTDAVSFSWMNEALRLLAYESGTTEFGRDLIVRRLTEMIFVQAIRIWQDRTDDSVGFVRLLADPQMARVLAAFHKDPGNHWTVETLARSAGASRTVFSERFRRLSGVTPMQYASQWRMQIAKRLLSEGSLSVDRVADFVGYESVSAFSRVFKKSVGEAPATFRRKRAA